MPAAAANARILLVEDEFLIQDLIETTLQDAGYEVIAVDNGEAALEVLAAGAGDLAGLISDVNLGPGPSGWEIAARARELNAGIAVVYISGDSAHDWTSRGVPKSVMVSKPFAAIEVVVALAGLRNAADPAA